MNVTRATKAISILFYFAILINDAIAKEKLVIWEDLSKGDSLVPIVKEFEIENDCTVEIYSIPSLEQVTKYQSSRLFGPVVPDILTLQSSSYADALLKDSIIPLDFMQNDKYNYIEQAVSTFTYNDKIYAAPRSIECLVVYYNRDLISYPFENLSDYANFADNNKGIYGLIGKFDQFYFSYGFINAHGGYIFGKNADGKYDYKDVGLTKQNTLKGLEALFEYSKDYIPKEILGPAGYTIIDELFTSGKVAAVIDGPWKFEQYAKTGMNYGVAALPKLDNGNQLSPFYTVKGYAITKSSKNKELAAKLLKFLNQKENATRRYLATGELPPVKSVFEVPFVRFDDMANTILTETLNAKEIPATTKMNEVWKQMDKTVSDIVSNKKTVNQAFNNAVLNLNLALLQN